MTSKIMDNANIQHGTKETVSLEIISISTNLNKNDKYSVEVVSKAPYKYNVVQITPEQLDNWADKIGLSNGRTLAKFVNTSDEPCFFDMTCTYKEAGQPIGLNDDGTPIKSTTGSTVHTKSYWDSTIEELICSDDVYGEVKKLSQALAIQLELQAETAKKANATSARQRRRRARNDGAAIVQAEVVTSVETTSETTEEEIVDAPNV